MTRIALENEPSHPAQVRPGPRGTDDRSPRTLGWVRLLTRMSGAFLSGLAVPTPPPELEDELRI
ncbi:hypothetical protein [Deinococcus apachensis]|uniref:hypothetical protein n=1 Tax=Deinococcus apachensis TaxID=309886 RepID=UPI0003681C45|nr:hypothetical protein [Deinococcus apachensis]